MGVPVSHTFVTPIATHPSLTWVTVLNLFYIKRTGIGRVHKIWQQWGPDPCNVGVGDLKSCPSPMWVDMLDLTAICEMVRAYKDPVEKLGPSYTAFQGHVKSHHHVPMTSYH